MDRRGFVKAGLASAFAAALPGQPAPERHFYELRIYELRNDIEPTRIQTFFEEHYVPALRRLGVGPVGVFTPEAGIPGRMRRVAVPRPPRVARTNGVTGSGRERRGSAALCAQECGGADASGQRTRTGVPKSPVIPRNGAVPMYGCARCVVMVMIILVLAPFPVSCWTCS